MLAFSDEAREALAAPQHGIQHVFHVMDLWLQRGKKFCELFVKSRDEFLQLGYELHWLFGATRKNPTNEMQ